MFNLLPNLSAEGLARSFAVETNDMMLSIYLASLVRAVVALHNLIDNKEARAHAEREAVSRWCWGWDGDGRWRACVLLAAEATGASARHCGCVGAAAACTRLWDSPLFAPLQPSLLCSLAQSKKEGGKKAAAGGSAAAPDGGKAAAEEGGGKKAAADKENQQKEKE